MSRLALRVRWGEEVRSHAHSGNITYAEAAKDPAGCSRVGLGMKDSGMLAKCHGADLRFGVEKPDTCQSYLMSRAGGRGVLW